MQSRGVKQFAVMAMKDGWSKPRFVWTEFTRLLIFGLKSDASISAQLMNQEKTRFVPDDKPDKRIVVRWIVVPVWTETML